MSVVRVSAVSIRRRRFPVRDRSACQLRSYSRSHTPWPSFWPRVSKWVCGRQSGRGTAPRAPARLAMPRSHPARPTSAPHSPANRWRGASGRRARSLRTSRSANAGLHQATLVVALLVPGIGEVDAHLVQRCRRRSRAPALPPRRGGRRARCRSRPRPARSTGDRRRAHAPRCRCGRAPGRAARRSGSASPLPKPISSTRGALRPKAASKSRGVPA